MSRISRQATRRSFSTTEGSRALLVVPAMVDLDVFTCLNRLFSLRRRDAEEGTEPLMVRLPHPT
jgi:hypothetical protein